MKDIQAVYFVGAGGIGMSAIARSSDPSWFGSGWLR